MLYLLIFFFLLSFLAFLYLRKSTPRSRKPFSLSPTDKALQSSTLSLLPASYSLPSDAMRSFSPSSISYISTKSQLMSCIISLQSSSFLGIDIEESRISSYSGFVCLIQIATNDAVYLIDPLALDKDVLLLRTIFLDPNITKVFHGCFNDTQWLQRDFGMLCVNVFDTQIAGKALGLKKLGLNYLWKKYCGFVMPSEYKKKMQTSDWDKRPLTKEQLEYAALDSFFLAGLMGKLGKLLDEEQMKEMRLETNRICSTEFSRPEAGESCEKLAKKHLTGGDKRSKYVFCEVYKLADRLASENNENIERVLPVQDLASIAMIKSSEATLEPYLKSRQIRKNKSLILKIIQESIELPEESVQAKESLSRLEKKQQRYKSFLNKYTISKDIFENYQIQTPKGDLLCYANHKKAKWYLDRGLASIIQETPLIIRLTFEPNYNSANDDEERRFFKKEKKNECVCCGSSGNLLRYRVVPLVYRQFFTAEQQGFCRHDILLLCAGCHEKANKHADSLKKHIAKEYKVPLHSYGEFHQFKEKLIGIRKICVSLKKNRDKIPEIRLESLLNQVKEFVSGFEELETMEIWEVVDFLCSDEKCKNLFKPGETKSKNENCDLHGKLVMEKVEDVKAFIDMWKSKFIESLHPQYLPDSWKAKFNLQ
jgi:ribonuclease D